MTRRSWLKDPRKVFIGWWLAIGAGILCLWGYGYQAYGFSALFKPISEELDISRAATSVAASIGRFEGGVEGPAIGYISDRWGPRAVVLFGVFFLGLGLVLMNYTTSLWTYYAFWGVLVSTGTNIALSVPMDTAIANWFVRRRGIAMSIRWVFSGLSAVIGARVVAVFIVRYGWRMACTIGGVVMWGIGLPIAWFLIKPHRPEYYGLLPDGGTVEGETTESIEAGVEYAAETGEVEFTLRQAMTTRAFWMVILAYMFHGALVTVMNIHTVPFLTDRGIDLVLATTIMGIYVFASIPARLLGGILGDRVSVRAIRYLIAGSYSLQAVGVTLFLFNQQSMPILYLFFILYGLGMGAGMPLTPLLRARYFGRKAYGSITGVSALMYMPGGVAGPILAGWIWDTTGSYMLVFTLLAIALGVSAAAIFFATPPKPPKEISDITKRF